MEQLFIPYDLSVRISEAGFDEECFGWYNAETELIILHNSGIKPNGLYNSGVKKQDLHKSKTLAPLYQQVIDWLREEHALNIGMTYFRIESVSYWEYRIHYKEIWGQSGEYYPALTKAIEASINLIKNNKP